MDNMQFWESFWTAAGRMDMMTAKIASQIESFLKRKICQVLVAECNDFALCDQKGQLVFSSIGELAELDTMDFRTDCWCEFFDFATFWKEVFECWICSFAVFNMIELLKSRVFLTMVPSGKVCRVLLLG